MKPKLCIHCKHFIGRKFDRTGAECGHPDYLSIINGLPFLTCLELRKNDKECGYYATKWEAKYDQ